MIYTDKYILGDTINGKPKISADQINYQNLVKSSINIIHSQNYVHNKQEKSSNFRKIRMQTKEFPNALFSLKDMEKIDNSKINKYKENSVNSYKSQQQKESSFAHKLKVLNNMTKKGLKPKSQNNSKIDIFGKTGTFHKKTASLNNTFYKNIKEEPSQLQENSINSYEKDYKILQQNFDKHSDNSIIEQVKNYKDIFDQFESENVVNDNSNAINSYFIQRNDYLSDINKKDENKNSVKKFGKPDHKYIEKQLNESKKNEPNVKMSMDGHICNYNDFVNKKKLIVSFYQESEQKNSRKNSNFHKRSFSEKSIIPEKGNNIKHAELEMFHNFKERRLIPRTNPDSQKTTFTNTFFDKTKSDFSQNNINDRIKRLQETFDYNEFQTIYNNTQANNFTTEGLKNRIAQPNCKEKDNIEKTHKIYWALMKRRKEGLPPVTIDWRNKDLMVCQGVNKSSIRQKVDYLFEELVEENLKEPFNGYLTLNDRGKLVGSNIKIDDLDYPRGKRSNTGDIYKNFKQKSQNMLTKKSDWRHNYLNTKDQVSNKNYKKNGENPKLISANINHKNKDDNNTQIENAVKYDLKSIERKLLTKSNNKNTNFGFNTVSSFNINKVTNKAENKLFGKTLGKITPNVSNNNTSKVNNNLKKDAMLTLEPKNITLAPWENNL